MMSLVRAQQGEPIQRDMAGRSCPFGFVPANEPNQLQSAKGRLDGGLPASKRPLPPICSASPRVDARGNVYPCQIFAGVENSLGNIFDFHSLTEILGSAGCHMVIDRIRNRKEKLKRKCCVCPYDDFCMGGCPATAFNQTGNLETVDNQCYFIKYCFKNRYNFFETDICNMEKCDAGCIF